MAQVILVPVLHLASQSPRRRELLARLGVPFGVLDVQVPEQRAPGETAENYVRRVAREKAEAGYLRVALQPDALVLAGDTEVVLDGVVFGKPHDAQDAAAMLRRLSGRTHQVISAVTLVSAARQVQAVSISEVSFEDLDEDTIARYVASSEPMGRAGGYAIQGYAETFTTRLSGSYSGVMGLPLRETAMLLREQGLRAEGLEQKQEQVLSAELEAGDSGLQDGSRTQDMPTTRSSALSPQPQFTDQPASSDATS